MFWVSCLWQPRLIKLSSDFLIRKKRKTWKYLSRWLLQCETAALEFIFIELVCEFFVVLFYFFLLSWCLKIVSQPRLLRWLSGLLQKRIVKLNLEWDEEGDEDETWAQRRLEVFSSLTIQCWVRKKKNIQKKNCFEFEWSQIFLKHQQSL